MDWMSNQHRFQPMATFQPNTKSAMEDHAVHLFLQLFAYVYTRFLNLLHPLFLPAHAGPITLCPLPDPPHTHGLCQTPMCPLALPSHPSPPLSPALPHLLAALPKRPSLGAGTPMQAYSRPAPSRLATVRERQGGIGPGWPV